MAICSCPSSVRAVGLFILFGCAGCSQPVPPASTPAGWQAAFRQRVAGADELEVVIRAGCDDDRQVATFCVDGEEAVQEIVALIQVQHYDSGFVSICGGNDTLTFSREGQTLVELERTPLSALSWDDPAWQGDAVVSRDSYQRITKWFESRGFTYFTEELRAVQETAKRQQMAIEAFVADFPPDVRRLILDARRTQSEINVQQALRLMASSRDTYLAIFKCLGRLRDSDSLWTMTEPMTHAVLALAHGVPDQSQFWLAVQDLADDPAGQLGAARLLFRERIGASSALPAHSSLQVALATRVLADGFDSNKPDVIWHLRHWNEPEAVTLLRRIAMGTTGSEIDPAEAWNDEPGIRFMALLALSQRGENIDDKEWDECSKLAVRPQDRAAVEIAGHLIGKDSEIQVEHFRFQSYMLGAAAIEALSDSPGPRSLGLLVDGAMQHPWAAVTDQAELAVEAMIGQSWERRVRRKQIEEWMSNHPDAWIRPSNGKP